MPENPEPLIIEGAPQYEVAEIIASQKHKRSLQYCVAWKGYLSSDNSWVDPKECTNCQELIKEFHQKNPGAPTLAS